MAVVWPPGRRRARVARPCPGRPFAASRVARFGTCAGAQARPSSLEFILIVFNKSAPDHPVIRVIVQPV
jgi:hypothetical protein